MSDGQRAGAAAPARSRRGSEVRVEHQPGFVLHTYPWRETSLIVEALTRDHGRVALVARGAKRRTSQLRGVLSPFSALALAVLAERAGVPAGIFHVLTGSSSAIGGELTSNPTVRKLTFTGSTEVGSRLMQQCAKTIKKLSLELGGNAPFIVFDDADLKLAAQGAAASKYRNSGQTCICANRIMVQDTIYDEFIEELKKVVGTYKIGDGLDESVTHGPLISRKALEDIKDLVDDALEHGATVAAGGEFGEGDSHYVEPTILCNVNDGMRIFKEEIFGPIAPIYKFSTEEEAIAMANDTEFGLACYFYSRDIGRIWRVAEGLEYGIVGINEGIISTEVAPFGGVKESGMGREGSKYGLMDFTEIKYVCVGGVQ